MSLPAMVQENPVTGKLRKLNRVILPPDKTARRVIPLLLACFFIVGWCAGIANSTSPAPPKVPSESLTCFLTTDDLPDSLRLLPPPPAPGTAAFAADEEAYRTTRAFRGTPRWALAASDADLTFPEAAGTFSCALGVPVTEEATPHLYRLLRRIRTDASHVTGRAKDHYRRARPFTVTKEATCTPLFEPMLRKNSSYPSGHSTIGWVWALTLTEIAPDRTDAILGRGFAFGQNRVICGVHWQSDVTAGRVVAAGVVARLHANPAFRAQLEAARAELAAARAKGLKPSRDCKAEAAALAFPAPLTP
jgi:acid phosphatase (class A)